MSKIMKDTVAILEQARANVVRSGRELAKNSFHPNLSWSHYRALMRVENASARDFYEAEAVRCGWKKIPAQRGCAKKVWFKSG